MLDVVADRLDVVAVGGLHLVDDDDIGHAHVRLSWVVGQLVAGAVRVGQNDVHVALVEREVVVAAIPYDDVGLLLRLAQDLLVVDACIHDDASVDQRLVLLPLLDRGLVKLEVLIAGISLNRLLYQIAVRHRVANRHDAEAHVPQDGGYPPRGGALSRAGPDGADADHRDRGLQNDALVAHEDEVGSPRQHFRRDVHDRLVGDVGVCEHHLVHLVLAYQALQLLLGQNGDPVRITVAGQLRRVAAPLDVRYLRGRERYHLIVWITTIVGVEVVKVTSRGSHDDCPYPSHPDLRVTSA